MIVPVTPRAIIHVDMDAFYAAIEEREDPGLRGRPVVVGGTPAGRGVVAAANYEARKYGIASAMPAARAYRLCPHAVFLPARHAYYAEVSRQMHAILQRYTPLVEPLSLDEAFLDVSASTQLFGAAPLIGRRIKQEIAQELRLVASVGVAPNKFLAKIASDLQKPDGFVVVEPGAVQAFLDPLPVTRLWGVGKVGTKCLHALSVRTIVELRRLPQVRLQELFGGLAGQLLRLAHGTDERAVVPEQQAKSISHETTFEHDLDDRRALRAWLLGLTQQVGWRLRRLGLRAQTVHVKVRFADFRTRTRACTLPNATDVTRELWAAAQGLLERSLGAGRGPVRLLGVGVSGIDGPAPAQGRLFEERECGRQRRIDAVADRLRERYGAGVLRRATDLTRPH